MADADPKILRNIAYAWLYITVAEQLHPEAENMLQATKYCPQALLKQIRDIVAFAKTSEGESSPLALAKGFVGIHPLDDAWSGDDEHPDTAELDSIFINPTPFPVPAAAPAEREAVSKN
jgi:hypothetical protein